MKKYIMIAAVLFTGILFAQNTKPQLEVVGNQVKATFHHENGQIQQQGHYLDGKLQGEWTSYDTNGNKVAIGSYSKGQKVGKWFFWNNAGLSEVDYSDNRIASVKNWKKDAVVNID
ncbi:MAG: membrane-binding protein [Flavobacteriaceae bacterium]|jgi:antitoxin component YwqK of YwqJK toxin-antitoxin module|uniref:Membrane-binding protein n=1 Tax=Flavobacterium kayseriense TaxID=2764714 RepID=A0ABR7J5E9_9FLAO|nr:membrane-binding protein [Flavobacterium kayseriense]MBC5840692.1 membrane-binding protein [Flavobacterium kayseriense]MBC5846638.1 membrane-binding protein [Flavobacterium kayseriense]MBU0941072.1 membrane-binding protein [Bacteroidota bacterium]MBX9888668.1 membrane-binding protein [Flavobacteriaceae bacterium]